ncbi:hypothetical protein TNCV_2923411 [Trichonephila clavipes]|nr:hypothetical protein TNCV_2923411 [Trichonephila clavipes]
MEEPIDLRGAPGEDPLKCQKEYDRVANFNKWDDMMCLANVYFFLDGTAETVAREYTVLHTKCIRTLPRGKSSDERRRKSVTPNERCC